jgi:hypothetical protein
VRGEDQDIDPSIIQQGNCFIACPGIVTIEKEKESLLLEQWRELLSIMFYFTDHDVSP